MALACVVSSKRSEPEAMSSFCAGAVVPRPILLLAASRKNVLLSMLRLLGVETASVLIVRVSPLASPTVVFPLTLKSVVVVKLPGAVTALGSQRVGLAETPFPSATVI